MLEIILVFLSLSCLCIASGLSGDVVSGCCNMREKILLGITWSFIILTISFTITASVLIILKGIKATN